MNCAELETVMPEAMEGAALPDEVAAHLEQCEACGARLEEMRRLWIELEANDDPGSATLPPGLKVITEDLEATSSAERRAPLLLVVAGAVAAGAVGMARFRPDLFSLPVMYGPGGALLSFGLAAVALRMGLKLSGMQYRRGIALLAVVALVFFLQGTLSGVMLPGSARGAGLERGVMGWRSGLVCVGGLLAVGAPILAMVAWLLRAARLPTPLSSVVLGAGAGLVGAGVLQLHCPISTVQHLLMYHGGALVLCALTVGAAGGYVAHRNLDPGRPGPGAPK